MPFFFLMTNGGNWTRNVFKENSKDWPLVSIVTVTFNAATHLAQALDSILDQSYPNIELIIIDGGSSDGTISIIQERESKIDFWISEPDKGIYDAMNKGLALARGKWIAFKNADDWFLPDAILNFVSFSKLSDADVYCGNSLSVIQENPLVTSPFMTDANRIGRIPGIDHRSIFIRTEHHKKVPFDTKYRLAADLDTFWRLKKAGSLFINLDAYISYKRFGGASDGNMILSECFEINRRHAGFFFASKSWVIFQSKFFTWKLGNRFLKFFLGKERFNQFKSRKLK